MPDTIHAVDADTETVVRRCLARYQAQLDQVRARGGAYAQIGFSPHIESLLAKLEAGATLTAGKVH